MISTILGFCIASELAANAKNAREEEIFLKFTL